MPDNLAFKSIQDNLAAINDIKLASANMQSASGITEQLRAISELTAVLTRLGLMGGSANAEKTQNDVSDNDDFSDNVNDENYRYADTGYISGSHKEQAKNRIKEFF